MVEEDVQVSPFFLRFMNDALQRYAEDDRVLSVGAWNYFAKELEQEQVFFYRYPDSIAWATWQRAWQLFERDGVRLRDELLRTGRMNALEADGQVAYFAPMLQAQIDGKVDSWAIRWTATSVLHGKLNLFPGISLAKHLGFGADATHERGSADYNAGLLLATAPVQVPAVEPVETAAALANWVAYVKGHFQGGTARSWRSRLGRRLPRSLKQWYTRQRTPSSAAPAQVAFEPVSRIFGLDRGQPVDRGYIERFLRDNARCITGHVMEIGEDRYMSGMGSGVERAEVLVFDGASVPGQRVGDLTQHNTLPVAELDAFICTQTLNFIFDVKAAIEGIHHSLKPGGVALVTVAGLCQISRYDADRWGDYWRFTPQSMQRLFEEVFGKDRVEISVFGNSYAATCLLKGFALEECDPELLRQVDADYPVVIGVKAIRS